MRKKVTLFLIAGILFLLTALGYLRQGDDLLASMSGLAALANLGAAWQSKKSGKQN